MKERWLPIVTQAASLLIQPLLRQSTGDATSAAGMARVKKRTGLKLKELEEDSSTVEFSNWCKEFTIYHSVSNLHLASKREQQINLYSHLDEALKQ